MLTFWLVSGAVLAAMELVIPGAVISFVGLGALTSAGFIYLGIIDSWVSAFLCWFIASIFYLYTLRSFAVKFLPGEVSVDNTDEEKDATGREVLVSEEITPGQPGRIKHLDTSWIAYSDKPIQKGEYAVLVSKNGNGWNVSKRKEGL